MNSFVYVVCGSIEHIETLNFSLKFMNYFSLFPVLVITDNKRNEIAIEHNTIINIDTPPNLDNHQASIYLKTSIHKYLNFSENNSYCYIDSDVIAINSGINTIFNKYKSPITFAKDHCLMNEFSPYAINCNCLSDQLRKNKKFGEINAFFKQLFGERYKENSLDRILLNAEFDKMKKHYYKNSLNLLVYILNRYVIPQKQFKFKNYYFDKKKCFWYTKSNEIFHFDYKHFEKKIQESTGIFFDKKTRVWKDINNEIISPQTPNCHHLIEHISQKYHQQIPSDWQHWNGGVFLFNKESFEFLDFWHKITIHEFNNSYTKTRDQGTLAVSAWRFGLQHHPTLSDEYNFITEFNNPKISYKHNFGFTKDGFISTFNPNFLHIFHEWGHDGWSIWDYVMELGKKNNIL
ncbi:MAG: hypothetical protein PHY85_00580 [Bacteroidales bacterium]|nr:hypothetical protein [Bacteroidales bacterium]